MNKQQLASKIWKAANEMRSKIEANEYKDYILGFIFYKFLSDKEEQEFIKAGMTPEELKEVNEDNIEAKKYAQENLGYFIAYENLFSTWLKIGNDFTVDNVSTALSAFSRLIYEPEVKVGSTAKKSDKYQKVFGGIFKTLQNGISNLGSNTGEQTKSIRGLVSLIKEIPMDGRADYDVLGFIYEYLISNFAANAGKKAGEFYTPYEVSFLMSEIVAYHLKDNDKIEIYDPTSGSGSLLINIGKSVQKHIQDKNNIKYYAQELKEPTYNLTRMNLIMRGISADNIVVRNGDTLKDDWPYFDENDPVGTYHPLYVDAVVSNPPYSQKWDPTDKDAEPRYKNYGVAPKSKADYAFLLHDLYHVKPNGIMTIVLPHGVLFRGGNEEEIRKNLIEKNNIDAIIGLPANIFFGTGIPTIIMVLKQKRENTDILIIDASKGFTKEGKNNKLRSRDIRRIVDAYKNRIDIPKFAKVVSLEEIRKNGYNLNIPRYVDSSEMTESYDIYATMNGGIPNSEIEVLSDFWKVFPSLKDQLFKKINGSYSEITQSDISEIFAQNNDIIRFKNNFMSIFGDFDDYLRTTLIDKIEELNVVRTEEEITDEIFSRFNHIELIDKYQAYQIFSDEYKTISIDLEVLQTEGIESLTKVIPNMIIKKKGDKEEEKQEGWKGQILPFELVQREKLSFEVTKIEKLNAELAEIASKYEEFIENIPEDEKGDILNEDNTAFNFKEVKKIVKGTKNQKVEAGSIEDICIQVDRLSEKEKAVKKQIKELTAELHLLTKKTIENLTMADALELLDIKWNRNICNGIISLLDELQKNLKSKIISLKSKYEVTLSDLDRDIDDTSSELINMIDELVGNEFDIKGLQDLKKLLGGE